MNSSNRTDAATPGSADYRSKRRIRILATFGFLSIALIVITVVSAGLGQYNIPTDLGLSVCLQAPQWEHV